MRARRAKANLAASIQTRVLQRLLEMLGSRAKLARLLRVSEDDLQRWLNGKVKAPALVFIRAVDLLLEETEPSGGDEGDLPEPPAERDCAADDSAHKFY